MKFVLDTNIVSEARKIRPHGAVLAWYAAQPFSSYAIPAIVLYELQQGAELTRLQDKVKANEIQTWIDSVMRKSTILDFDGATARETARLMRQQSPHLFGDATIAATARVYGLTVATRNIRDFAQFNVPVVNPFLFGR